MTTRRSPRASARREVLKQLREVRESVQAMLGWWTVRGYVWIPLKDRVFGENVNQRPREMHEYPEAQRMYWRATANEIGETINNLLALRKYCLDQAELTPERAPDGS